LFGVNIKHFPSPVSSHCILTLKIEETNYIIRGLTFRSPVSINAINPVATDISSANSRWVKFKAFQTSASRSFMVISSILLKYNNVSKKTGGNS